MIIFRWLCKHWVKSGRLPDKAWAQQQLPSRYRVQRLQKHFVSLKKSRRRSKGYFSLLVKVVCGTNPVSFKLQSLFSFLHHNSQCFMPVLSFNDSWWYFVPISTDGKTYTMARWKRYNDILKSKPRNFRVHGRNHQVQHYRLAANTNVIVWVKHVSDCMSELNMLLNLCLE